MKTEYMIISSSTKDKLTSEVNSRIGEGWLPQGGVFINNQSNSKFLQAMILTKVE